MNHFPKCYSDRVEFRGQVLGRRLVKCYCSSQEETYIMVTWTKGGACVHVCSHPPTCMWRVEMEKAGEAIQ